MINPLPRNAKLGVGVGIGFGYVDGYPGGYHSGIDMHAEVDSDVLAALDGKVLYADDTQGDYGKCVNIEHAGGLYTTYAHLDSIDVDAGQEVKQGDRIGGCGNTGNSKGPHLHFEVRKGVNTKKGCVDPMEYIVPRPYYWEKALRPKKDTPPETNMAAQSDPEE